MNTKIKQEALTCNNFHFLIIIDKTKKIYLSRSSKMVVPIQFQAKKRLLSFCMIKSAKIWNFKHHGGKDVDIGVT